jgi:glycosidase
VLRERPSFGAVNQWANFVRNHDELTLDQLTERERHDVFEAFGPDPGMQLYGRGLRRRLPSMVDGDQRRVRLLYSLAFSLPGSPVLFYGEEIGMSENLDVPDRLAVRTPMQWEPGRGGGFSAAPPRSWPRRMPSGRWGPDMVSVAAQRRDPSSLWRFIQTLIRVYRESPQLGWSRLEVLAQPHPAVLAHVCHGADPAWRMLALHHFGSEATDVEVELGTGGAERTLVDRFTGDRLLVGDHTVARLHLEPYEYRWFIVEDPTSPAP